MELTDERLKLLSKRGWRLLREATETHDFDTMYLCGELISALAPQPCGHPGAALARDGMCGWCRSQNKADDFRKRLWKVVAERDALCEKLKAAENVLASAAEFGMEPDLSDL